jgi:hypothetical protein
MILPGVVASTGLGAGAGPTIERIFVGVPYTGNGTGQSVTGVGFEPDLVMLKADAAATFWGWFDKKRGVERYIRSNDTTAETLDTASLLEFLSDGFRLGSFFNTASSSRFGFCFREQVGALSIITYTGDGLAGRTVAHGLGVAPEAVFVKRRDLTNSWRVYLGARADMRLGFYALDTTGAYSTFGGTTIWDSTDPDATNLKLGTNATVNASGSKYVMYCMASKEGVSKVGSYEGNGTTQTPKITTGFRPRGAWIKRIDGTATSNWAFANDVQSPSNPHTNFFRLNTSDAAQTSSSNFFETEADGFRLNNTLNISGATYWYWAF